MFHDEILVSFSLEVNFFSEKYIVRVINVYQQYSIYTEEEE